MNWDIDTMNRVRSIRSRVTISVYDFDQSTIPPGEYIEILRKRAVSNFQKAVRPFYGAVVHPGDMKFWEEPFTVTSETGEEVAHRAIVCRWFPATTTVEMMGGPRDGEHMVIRQGEVGQPIHVVSPAADPIWDAGEGDTIPEVQLRKVTYYPSGWSEGQRIWLYSPMKY